MAIVRALDQGPLGRRPCPSRMLRVLLEYQKTLNPKPYITNYNSFHFLFHYPYITPIFCPPQGFGSGEGLPTKEPSSPFQVGLAMRIGNPPQIAFRAAIWIRGALKNARTAMEVLQKANPQENKMVILVVIRNPYQNWCTGSPTWDLVGSTSWDP